MAAHYDREDVLFRALWGDHLHHGVPARGGHHGRAIAAVERVARLLGLRAGSGTRLLDIGCGYGGPALHLANAYGANVCGITLSASQFERAQQLAAEFEATNRPRFVLGDWLANRFEDSSFDGALSVECFGHVADKQRFLSELKRVLVPGGRCVLALWAASEAPSRREKSQLEAVCREARLTALVSPSELHELVQGAGLEWVDCEDWSRDVLGTWPRAAAHSAWLTLRRRDVRARVFGADGQPRVPAAMAWRMTRALRGGALTYLVVRIGRSQTSDQA